MAGDNEIIALKGGGVSLYKLLPPVIVFCTIITCFALWVSIVGVPKSKSLIEDKTIEIAQSSLGVALQERVFNADIEGLMLYVSSVDTETKQLSDVFIEDSRTKGMVTISTAPDGVMVLNEKSKIYTLRLYNGKMNQVDLLKNSVNTILFSTYDINVDYKHMLKESGSKREKDLDEMSLKELHAFIKGKKYENKTDLNNALMGLHGKFSLPFACICLGILAFPLGIQSVSLKRSSGFGLGLFFFIVYYLLLAIGWSAGESGKYPPVVGMWVPDIIMGGAGLFLLYRNAKERPVRMPLFISRLISKFIIAVKILIFRKRAE